MSVTAERARSSWLLSFADVITLLITFFIMMLALNHTEISRIQKWTEDQLNQSYVQLSRAVETQGFQYIQILRDTRGINLSISHPGAFERGGYQVSAGLAHELSLVAVMMRDLPLFSVEQTPIGKRIIDKAVEDGMSWRVEIVVEGHTDNDPIDASSVLRNNWFLSTMRAQNVMQLLYRDSQLANELFSVAGFGEHRPVASNDTLFGKGKNRRVDILINASFTRASGVN